MKKFIKKTKPLRKVTAAGDGNADLLLYKADEILDPLFVRLDNVHKKTFLKHLKELV